MSDFSLWFAYYDSLFMNPEPKLSYQFYMDNMLQDVNWPIITCPSLSNAYNLLQNFLITPDNWATSQCKIQQLDNAQKQLDNLMRFVQLEKSYAYSFWDKDPRRVQASTVHLYTFLQLLAKAAIPYPTMSIFQIKTANKLCLKLSYLEKMMNGILGYVNAIAQFLSDDKFKQQYKIITNFFENWVYFMKKLPSIKRNKLNHVHNLVKFIFLTNPIEICTVNIEVQYGEAIRRKSNTVGAKILQIQSYPFQKSKIYLPFRVYSTRKQQEKSRKVRKKSMSCQSSLKLDINKAELQSTNKKLFSFPIQILAYAKQQQNRKKKETVSSLNSLKNLNKSVNKIATQTTNETILSRNKVITPKQKNKQKIRSSSHRQDFKSTLKKTEKNNSLYESEMFSYKFKQTKFYDQQTQRNEQISSVRSSKESTIRRRQLSLMNMIKDLKQNNKYSNIKIFQNDRPKLSLNQGKLITKTWYKLIQNIQNKAYIQQIQKIISNQK